MKDDKNDRVGFKKTPRHTRFRSGTSGNPKGRPKGRKNYRTRFFEIINEKITVNENGRRRQLPKFDIAVRQAVNKAMTGDPRGMKMLLELYRQFAGDSAHDKQPINIVLSKEELEFV
jgi:Family of unknown function (DUF5681)